MYFPLATHLCFHGFIVSGKLFEVLFLELFVIYFVLMRIYVKC